MGLRFRETFQLFPGVRLNLSGNGISATFGIPGASVNVGPRGIHSTVGIPGSGLSFTSNLTGHVSPQSSPSLAPSPAPTVPYWVANQMREIGSASVENLTSHGLVELRDLIAQAREQRGEIVIDLEEARAAYDRGSADLERRRRSWFRCFYRRRIAELETSVPEAEQEIMRLAEWQQSTHIDMSFKTGDPAQKAYGTLIRAFEALRGCGQIWDITSDRIGNRVIERSYASRTITRTPVKLDFADSDLVRFAGRAMQFENINGENILIYPGVALMPRADGAFGLIDLREIKIDFNAMQFVEQESVPSDTQVVGQTWAKVNKNGTPDLRFKANYQRPLCLYGRLFLPVSEASRKNINFRTLARLPTSSAPFTRINRPWPSQTVMTRRGTFDLTSFAVDHKVWGATAANQPVPKQTKSRPP